MKPRIAFPIALLLAALAGGEPLDRVAVTVGNRVITESALLLDLRVTAFINQAPLDFGPAAKRAEAERLVDLILINKEAADSHLVLAGVDQPVLLAALRARFRAEQEYQAEMARYGIRESDVNAHMQASARTMAFSDLRFRPTTQISEEDLRAYYDKLVAGRPSDGASFEAGRAQIEDLLRGQRALEALDEWLKMQRKVVRIDYRERVFQ